MKQNNDEDKTKIQSIQEEAAQYYNMAKEYRRERYMKEEKEVFI